MYLYKRESDAWREIARRVAERGLASSGLCYEIDLLYGGDVERDTARVIDGGVWGAMDERIRRHLDGATYLGEPFDAPPRVLMALFLALEAEDEGR